MGTQKNRLNETTLLSTQKHMLKLLGKKILKFCADYFCLSKPVSIPGVVEMPISSLKGAVWSGFIMFASIVKVFWSSFQNMEQT